MCVTFIQVPQEDLFYCSISWFSLRVSCESWRDERLFGKALTLSFREHIASYLQWAHMECVSIARILLSQVDSTVNMKFAL